MIYLQSISYQNQIHTYTHDLAGNITSCNNTHFTYDKAGRFLTHDPAGYLDAYNLYQYTLNNPLRYTDPYGASLLADPLLLAEQHPSIVYTALTAINLEIRTIPQAAVIWSGSQLCQRTQMANPSLGRFDHSPLLIPHSYIYDFAHDSVGITSTTNVATRSSEYVQVIEKRSTPNAPDPYAEGKPHSIIDKPGPEGSYTTFNEDGTFKQYRGTGKAHGDIPRPNIKENEINSSPSGPQPGRSTVREARPDEIPKHS